MTISKNSALYKTAYFWKLKEDIPQTTSLCGFIDQIVFSAILVPILLLSLSAIMIPVLLACVFFSFLCGYYPRGYCDLSPTPTPYFVKINWWPKIKGFRLLPIYPIAIGVLGYLYFYVMDASDKQYFSILLFLFLVIGGVSLMLTHKNKICPIITFTEQKP